MRTRIAVNDREEPPDLRDIQPSSWRHVIGERHVTQALQIAVEASFVEKKRFDELLLCGPPGRTSFAAYHRCVRRQRFFAAAV